MKKTVLGIIVVVSLLVLGNALYAYLNNAPKTERTAAVTNFLECVAAGNPVMESYPRRCQDGDRTYTEDVDNEPGKTNLSCKKDSDCPSVQYTCQEIQGTGTACPDTDPSCMPTHVIIQGECKLKASNSCSTDSDCAAGNLCHKKICTSPIGRQCSGMSDNSCPADFSCIQGCGPPVVRYPDDTPPSYFCQLKGYDRPCPICLAKNTLIDTPLGMVAVQNLQKGAPVWTINKSGMRVAGVVTMKSKTAVPTTHKMVRLVLTDGRTLLASPGHPTTDGRMVGDLARGDFYDGAVVVSSDHVDYSDEYTYDILASGETGFYWANNVLLDSTLHYKEFIGK